MHIILEVPLLDAKQLADDLDRRVRALPAASTMAVRHIRREGTRALKDRPGSDVLAVAFALVAKHRWMAYELIYHHPNARRQLDVATIENLGAGFGGWGDVDSFARYISGPAWRLGLLDDEVIRRWAHSPDRWWRRAALVSTVPLNLRAAGGTGDTERTLAVCALLVDDRDDMVVKGLSWALRELVFWDPEAVRAFIVDVDSRLAARVRREVGNKLESGRKQRPTAASAGMPTSASQGGGSSASQGGG